MKMKEIERKLIYELMKNCRQSDSELAKAIGASQPTVTKTRRKLEKNGIIKEYALIPNFGKLGFDIMAFTFIRYRRELSDDEYHEVKKTAKKYERQFSTAYLMAVRGMGLGCDRAFVSFHEDYSSYTRMLAQLRQLPFTTITDMQSFLVSLKGMEHYQPLTLSIMANYLLLKE